MRPDRGGAGQSAPWHGIPSEAVDVDQGQLVYPSPERSPCRRGRRCMRNQHTTRRRTFSVSAARSAWVIGRAGRNAGGPSPVGTKTPSVALGSKMHVMIERRSEALQKGDGAESRASRARPVAVTSRASCRRRGSTGIATTGCLHPTTSSGGPSRRWQSGMSASGKTPRPADIRTTVAPQEAVVTRIESPARTTRRGLRGPSSWRG